MVGIESEHDLITTNQLPQPFFSVLQKVILAGGCKYFRTLAINFSPMKIWIFLLNSLKCALENSFELGCRHDNIIFAWV